MLALYGYSIWAAINLAEKCGDIDNCTYQLSANISLLFNVIGGLISATVVGVLGSTNRGDFPKIRLSGTDMKGLTGTLAAVMPSVIILFWIVFGVVILVWGFLPFAHDPVPALSAQAKAWLGTAVGAVYAYLGVNPDPPKNGK